MAFHNSLLKQNECEQYPKSKLILINVFLGKPLKLIKREEIFAKGKAETS